MKLKKFLWPGFFFALGGISILGQASLLREITSLFYGNELFYGLGLGGWLLFTGLGSLLAGKIKPLLQRPKISLVILAELVLLLPLIIVSLRFLVAQTVDLGGLADLRLSLISAGLCLLIFGLPLGAAFPLAVVAWKGKRLANRAYFWETLGFAGAGLIFSLFLASSSFPLFPQLNQLSLSWLYQDIVKIENSRHHQIIVTETGGQQNFFLNGQISFTTQESLTAQKLVSLVSPFAPQLKKALVLGNPNLANELQNQPEDLEVDFLELDQPLLELEKDLLDQRVNSISRDPRQFFNQTQKEWGLIFFSPGNPQTLLTNRHYTQESFTQINKHLADKGIFALVFYLPTDYQSQEAIYFASSVYQAFAQTFPHLELLSFEDQLLLIGSQSQIQLDETKIKPGWEENFWLYLEDRQRDEIATKISSVRVPPNTDLEPTAFFYQQLFWQTMLSFSLPRLISSLARLTPLILLVLVWLGLHRSSRELKLGTLVASSSFLLLSFEVLIILLFQSQVGYLYHQLSLIFASALLGMAVGVHLAQSTKAGKLNLQLAFFGYLSILTLFLVCLETTLVELPIFSFASVFLVGLIGGSIFAQGNRLYLNQRNHPGFIYAFDLFGGFAGAILTTTLLLPVFGVRGLIFGLSALALINLFSARSISARTNATGPGSG